MTDDKIFIRVSGVLLILSALFKVRWYGNISALFSLSYLFILLPIFIKVITGITMLLGSINIGTVIALAINLVLTFISLIDYAIDIVRYGIKYISLLGLIDNLFDCVIALLLIICAILVLIKKANSAKALSYVTVALYAVSTLVQYKYQYRWANYIIPFGLNIYTIQRLLVLASYVMFALYINSIQYKVETSSEDILG